MERTSAAAARIREIEAQQDDLLRQLEELERRSEEVLARHLPRPPEVAGTDAIEPTCGPEVS